MFDAGMTDAIEEAAQLAFNDLFSSHPGTYYYCSLVTTGEALPPVVSAWSKESLREELASTGASEDDLKWSCVDSPYYAYGEDHFSRVRDLFNNRAIGPDTDYDDWSKEFDIRLDSMVEAMRRLDKAGVFGTGQDRDSVVLIVEVIPPDETNTDRAKLLNPPAALDEWLAEAAE